MESPIREKSSSHKSRYSKKSSKHHSSRRSDSSSSPPPVSSKRRHHSSDEEQSNSDSDRESRHKSSQNVKSKSSHRDDKPSSYSKKKSKSELDDKKNKSNDKSNEPITSSNGGGGDLSLSIEETNKLRAKLGLKPLSLEDSKPSETSSSKSSNEQDNKKKTFIDKDTNQEFEHVPAQNIADIKEQKDFKQKLEEQREKRRLMEKLKKVKGLGDDSSDEEKKEDENKLSSAELWIKKQKEREEARRKEKMLEEMDQQFENASASIKKLSKIKNNNNNNKTYSEDNLKGLRVEHDQSYFKEGQEVILTLKDRSILKGTGDNLDVDDEDDADVLVNVNIMDDERAAKNNENKKKKLDYNPYDDLDDDGNFREKTILDKYNEELEGERKKSFRLGARGTYDASDDKFIERLNEEHKARAIKLDILSEISKPASDYYTQSEIESFKKPKKVRKVLRKNKMLKADDLLPLPTNTEVSIKKEKDTSITEKSTLDEQPIFKKKKMADHTENGKTVSLKDIDLNITNKNDTSDSENEEDDDSIDLNKLKDNDDLKEILEEEENVLEELHSVLKKTRTRIIEPLNLEIKQEPDLNENQMNVGVSFDNLNTFKEEPGDEDEEDNDNRALTLDVMSEFCRNLGSVPSTSKGGIFGESENEGEDEIMKEYANEKNKRHNESDTENEKEDEDVDEMEMETSKNNEEKDDQVGILDDEPVLDRGIAAALQLALNKGYLAKEKDKQNARLTKTNIEAVNFTIEEKNYYDIDDKYNRNRDRFSGPLSEFEEKKGYKPDVKIDYIDEKGRQMNEKEAFRYLSHKFHGKGSGKKKTEKRNKKYEEMEAMQKMSSVDTPLNTVALLMEKQKKLQQPYVVLSAQKGGKQDQVTLHKR